MAPSLREIFTPLISYVLLLGRGAAHQPITFEGLRSRIRQLLEDEEVLVKRHDLPRQDFDTARFAVIAWVDEWLLRSLFQPQPEMAREWKRAPLQVELYKTANAGEEFYERLDSLDPAKSDVREVYHLCLSLGFRGRYYDDSQEFKLLQLRRETAHKLPVEVVDLLDLDKRGERINQQPYDVKPPAARKPTGKPSYLVPLLAAALVAALVAWFFWPPPGRTREEILADLDKRTAVFGCAAISVVDFDDSKGTLTLGGRVESEQQQRQIVKAAEAIPEVSEVREAFKIVPRPFCEVIALLQPFAEIGKAKGTNLTVEPQSGCDRSYAHHDFLVIDIEAQQPLDHVVVDYYVADRADVAHIFPDAGDPDTIEASGLTIGGPESETRWEVQPPFGMEMITVIRTTTPLFEERRPAVEGANKYLDALRPALESEDIRKETVAAYCLINTTDK